MFLYAIIIVSALAILSGCTQAGLEAQAALHVAESPDQVVAAIRAWKAIDLQAAAARATAANHRAGMTCYPTLLKYVGADTTVGESLKVAGMFDAFEAGLLAARGGVQGLEQNPAVQDIHLNCAALVSEARFTLIKLGVIGGGAVLR